MSNVNKEPWSYAGAMPPEQEEVKKAAYQLAPWLSAALDDPNVCKEYKDAINAWFDAAMPAAPEPVSMEQRIDELEQKNAQLLEALKRARDTAMKYTLVARIPECGHFGGIAQDLDYVYAAIAEVKP